MQNMLDQRWLVHCRQIMWNDTSEMSLRIENMVNNNEKNIDNMLLTLSNFQDAKLEVVKCKDQHVLFCQKKIVFQNKK